MRSTISFYVIVTEAHNGLAVGDRVHIDACFGNSYCGTVDKTLSLGRVTVDAKKCRDEDTKKPFPWDASGAPTRCSYCGRFISYKDFDEGKATVDYVPDSAFTSEQLDPVHVGCRPEQR
mgnify:FL=1